ncbi:hypothetical protein ILUMI_12471 [Ignelater luminosus]|uniref:U11/U12 small nuclear ribonucleoprotein 35 kDa protein n=1 Tax=Ignelater luminosus TaxID=2038154 RepID=A0A8K0GCX1_IGNLU|nr:hypothetical protein ILUMI_12471 [Ignelater luminosus]
MSDQNKDNKTTAETWSPHAKYYDPIKIGSIDGTDTEPHDKAIVRSINSEYRSNRHVKGRPECTIFVSRLSPKTTKDTIKEVFSKYGRLKRFRLVKDIVTGIPKGYAFIEYETERAAEDAYRKAYKMYLDGQAIFVDFECERLLKGWKPRRLGGGFGGRKESGQLRFGGRDRPFRKPISLEIQEREQYETEQKNREYKRDEYKDHKHRDFHGREEKYRYSKERDKEYYHKHYKERSENLERSRSRERHEYEARSSSERLRTRERRSVEHTDTADHTNKFNDMNGKSEELHRNQK